MSKRYEKQERNGSLFIGKLSIVHPDPSDPFPKGSKQCKSVSGSTDFGLQFRVLGYDLRSIGHVMSYMM